MSPPTIIVRSITRTAAPAPAVLPPADVSATIATWLARQGMSPAELADVVADLDAQITVLTAVRDTARALAGMVDASGHG